MSIPPFFFRHPYFPTQECVGYGQREDIRIASACVILNAVRNLGQQVVRQGGFSKGHAARPSERILRDRQTQPTLPCYATVGRDSFPPFYTHGKLIAGRDHMSLRSLNVIRRKNPCPNTFLYDYGMLTLHCHSYQHHSEREGCAASSPENHVAHLQGGNLDVIGIHAR